jgi:hypothetical protein
MNSQILNGFKKLSAVKGLHTTFKEKANLEFGENIALIFTGEYF